MEIFNQDTLRSILIVAGIIAGTFIAGRLIVWILIDLVFGRLASRTDSELDDMILEFLRRPIYFIVVLLGFDIAVGQLRGMSASLQAAIQDVLFVMVVLVGSYYGYRMLLDVLAWYAQGVASRTQTRFDEQFVGFIRRVLQIVLVVVVGIIILDNFDVNVSGLVAGLGVGSLAIALAAQALLEDTIAGFTILVDRPFVAGDRILLPKDIGGIYGSWGDVEEVGLRITQVRSTDGVILTIPNSLLTKDVMINFSHQASPSLRVRIRVGLERTWSNVEQAISIIQNVLDGHDNVSMDPRPPQVIVRELRSYDVLVEARYYVESPREMRPTNSRVLSEILMAFEREGVEMSLPTEVSVDGGREGAAS